MGWRERIRRRLHRAPLVVVVAGDTAELVRAVRSLEGSSLSRILQHGLLPLDQSVASSDLEHAVYLAQLHCRLAGAQLVAAQELLRQLVDRAPSPLGRESHA